MFTLSALRQQITQLSDKRSYLIAYSGGLDSHVLLHALYQLRLTLPEIKLRAVHVNHGLSPNADSWQQHCESVCGNLSISCVSKKIICSNSNGESLEAVARNLRYRSLLAELGEEEILLTAHTKNDQAETVLLQLFRGAGPKGLSAMPALKNVGKQCMMRPLLIFSREQLEQYAKQYSLKWIEDESNQNLRFERNYLRHQVMPLLESRWPGLLNNLSRSAQHCAEQVRMNDALAEDDFNKVKTENSEIINTNYLQTLNNERKSNVLRFWFKRLQLRMPQMRHLKHIIQDLIHSRYDAVPCFTSKEFTLRRYRNALIIEIKLVEKTKQSNELMRFEKRIGEGLRPEVKEKISIRYRSGGETIKFPHRLGRRKLKKLFQEWNVPMWQRDKIPLIYLDDELIGVAGYYLSVEHCVGKNEQGFVVQWES